jgi:phage gp46-like protein
MNFAIDPHVCLAFPGQETLDSAALCEVTGRSILQVQSGTPTANNPGPNSSTQSRRVFATSNSDFFSSIEQTETTPPSTRMQDSCTFECVIAPTNTAGAASDVRTIYYCGNGTNEYFWVNYNPVTNALTLYWNKGSSTTNVITTTYPMVDSAWYYIAIRKTVTSGSGTGRLSTVEIWALPLAGATSSTWSDTPIATFTGQANQNPDPDAIYHCVGGRYFGGLNKPGSFYFAGLAISDIARPTSWLKANFNAFAEVVIPTTPPPPYVPPTIALVGSSSTPTPLADVALFWDQNRGSADIGIESNDIAQDAGLETAVLLTLHLDAYADSSDELPAQTTDRRGWWGDLFADVDGDRIGCKLWLLQFLKDVPTILALAPKIIRDGFQWMIDDQVAESVDVEVSTLKNASQIPNGSVSDWLGISIVITRPKLNAVNFLFQYNWQSQELRPANAI